MKLRLIGGWSCEGPLAFITGQAQLASPVTTLTFAPNLTFEAQAFPFPVRRKSWERPFLHTPLRGVWRGRLWHARIQRRGMPFSSDGWPEPLQGGERVSLPASAFGSWVKLIDSPGITASSHSGLDQFHGCVGFWAKCSRRRWALRGRHFR